MKKLLLCLLLCQGCEDFFYPADQYLQLPNGDEMRLHCNPQCPPPLIVLEVMKDLSENCLISFPKATYGRWQHYAITFSNVPWYLSKDPETQTYGATYHNKKAIYVYLPYDRFQRVLKWELLMASLEQTMPKAGEKKKIEWQLYHCPDF